MRGVHDDLTQRLREGERERERERERDVTRQSIDYNHVSILHDATLSPLVMNSRTLH